MEITDNTEVRKIISDLKTWFDEIKLQIKALTDVQYKIFLKDEVKAMFNINEDKLERWQKNGLAYTKIGHTVVFVWDDILSFLEENKIRN